MDVSGAVTDVDRYCRHLAAFFFVDGLDRDDLFQEARLAAWLAPVGAERIAARRRILDLLKFAQRRPRFAPAIEDMRLVDARADVVDLAAARERLRAVCAVPGRSERIALGRALRGEPIRRHEKALQVALHRVRLRLAA